MGQLVLLVVAAAWAAVLIPPLLRSRIENRPNSSVSDFRNQLSSLQRAMPSRGVAMRSMARPLAPSPLSRPAATGRPPLRSGVRTHGGSQARTGSTAPVARSTRTDGARLYDATPRVRSHGDRPAAPARAAGRPAARAAAVPARAALKRRRANVLFVLALLSACSLFLAATTRASAMMWVFGASFVALAGYVWVLGQLRRRDQAVAVAAPVARRTPEPARQAPGPVSRQKTHRASVRRQPGPARQQATDRWSAAV
jgi:hypothetical protein